MAYIGNSLTQQSFTGGMDQFNGNASNTTFGLSRSVTTPFDVNVFVESVYQRPGVAYTVSANTITFESAPSVGTNNIIVVYENFTSVSVVPTAGSVTPTTIAANTIQATLGYVPANKAGDTFTGNTTFTNTTHNGPATFANTTVHTGAATFSNTVTVANSGITFNDATQFNTASSFGMRNKIINGGFDFWQRTTSGSVSGSGYPAPDRWQWIFDGTPASTGTVSRQAFTLGQTDVPGNPKYYLQYVYTAVNTPNHYIRQPIEGVGTLAGQVCTFSFWARCTSGTIACQFQNQQEFGAGGSPSAGVYGIGTTNFTLTTTWQRLTFTHTMPSIVGKTVGTTYDGSINPSIYFPTNGSGTVQLANIQMEEGSIATPFERRHLATELALCQRYFCKTYPIDAAPGSTSSGQAGAIFHSQPATNSYPTIGQWSFPATMRATPSVTMYNPATGIAGSFLGDSTNYSGAAVYAPGPRGVTLGGSNVSVGATVYMSAHATAAAEL